MLEKGWNQRLPTDTVRKDSIEILPQLRFKMMLGKLKHHEQQSINEAVDYSKEKWEKSHQVPDLKVGDLVLVSTLNFNNIKGQKKLKDSYVGPFVLVSLHGNHVALLELRVELENKHPNFPVILIKPHQQAEKELFPLRNPTPLTVPPVEKSEDKKTKKLIKEWRLRGKNEREYFVRYRNTVHDYKCLAESEIPESDKLLRRFRH
ncbi:hypothetical protein O181_029246 [Austropuccinia psidii MF-1]|uniref:Chromo domain-containing protein n=1 Tax=Austropuccinia psidii MF-1 TaxID=1389203 RepID=A0A9Q3CW33_9BASI|nr:hypothetical protein [Austropuccinia psidii MF-1]